MALTESIEYDKIEVIGQYKNVQVRKATIIKRDGTEITRSFERFVLDPGTLDGSDNLVDNPLSKEPDGTTNIADEVKAVCNAVWTTSVKNAWKTNLISNKSSTPTSYLNPGTIVSGLILYCIIILGYRLVASKLLTQS